VSGGAARTRGARVVAIAAVAVVGLGLLIVAALTGAVGVFTDGPRGPRGSTYARGPEGLSSYAAALRADGREVVQRRAPLDLDAPLDPADTVVVLDAPGLAAQEAAALRRFVAAGGRAVLGGTDPRAWLPLALDGAPRWQPGGQPACHPVLAVPEAAGVTDVVLGSAGRWAEVGATLPFLACRGFTSATVASPAGAAARGRVVLLADSAPLQNRFLAARDDRALALGIVGARRRVVFAEQAHGFGLPSGVAALPRPARVAVLLTLIAAVLAAAAGAGRPRSATVETHAGAPGRLVLAAAVGRRLAGSGRPGDVAVPVQRAARAALARAGGLAAAAEFDDALLRAAGRRLGLAEQDVDVVLRVARDDDDLLAAARVLAALTRRP